MALNTPELQVLLGDVHVATLCRTRSGLESAYLPSTMSRLGVGGVCLSLSLRVTAKPIKGPPVENWVEALLPEGEARTVLEDRFEPPRDR